MPLRDHECPLCAGWQLSEAMLAKVKGWNEAIARGKFIDITEWSEQEILDHLRNKSSS